MKRLAILFTTILFCSSIIASAQEKGYYGLLEASGGYIYKYVPGSETAPQDFMLGVSYVNGYRFSPHFAMGLGVGVNYYFDFQQFSAPIYLHATADILKRNVTPYISLNLGNNFQLNGGKYNYPYKDALTPEQEQEEILRTDGKYGSGCYHYRGFFAEPSVGVKFNCAGKRANLGLAYAFDGVLNRTTDAYRRRNYPQFRLKLGVEF